MFLILFTWLLSGISHLGVWCIAFNRTHATALPRVYRKVGEKLVGLMVLLPVIGVIWTSLRTQDFSLFGDGLKSTSMLLYGYCLGCLIISPYFIGPWLMRRFLMPKMDAIKSQQREWHDISAELSQKLTNGSFGNLLGMVPFNQATKLAIERYEFQLESLPRELEGLTIIQLSDLHFTGQLRLEYFQELVRKVNEIQADLIFITGDLVDEIECLEWIEPIFGELRSKHGVFYIFGNHDCRIKDERAYRDRLAASGMIAVGGKWKVLELAGKKIALAGNELPWFGGAEKMDPVPPENVDLKILLSHSPDQLEWARPFRFNLMFAGHTHGGQIQFPIIGPIVAPSKFGVKYACGTFMIDKMLMHVSRGISGDESIRINCPPEVGVFTLCCKVDEKRETLTPRRAENSGPVLSESHRA